MWFKEMLNSTRDAEFDVCALCYHISFERLVPSFQYTTASSWQRVRHRDEEEEDDDDDDEDEDDGVLSTSYCDRQPPYSDFD